MQKLKSGIRIWQQMGTRYLVFRTGYELQLRSGLLEARFPRSLPLPPGSPDWEQARRALDAWPWGSRESLPPLPAGQPFSPEEGPRNLQGEYLLFSSIPAVFQKEEDWITHPKTGYRYDPARHWTRIPDMDPEAGDIKYVWERSRFHHIHAIMRHDRQTGSDHSARVFGEMESWIRMNPLNCGPNYRCSQEISLRVFNWLGALSFYRNSPAMTEARWQNLFTSLFGQMHHVWKNISFSRIAVRNNHAITECLALYIFGTLFPGLPGGGIWKRKGKQWLEEEIRYQVFPDGTFLQFSMNYNRVLVQLFTLAIRFADRAGDSFSDVFYSRAAATLRFLEFFCNEQGGHLPNYGANDGALFFQLARQDYRDYRPQLFALRCALGDEPVSFPEWGGEALWFGSGTGKAEVSGPKEESGTALFPDGGYAGIRDSRSLTFFRSGRHRDRPSQADNHHLDIWVEGQNLLRDGGSYLYNAREEEIRYFFGTRSHNTLMIDRQDQMEKGPRFVWYRWSQSHRLEITETRDSWKMEGEIEAFSHVAPGIRHIRSVEKDKNSLNWTITDTVTGHENRELELLWHPAPEFGKILGMEVTDDQGRPLEKETARGWYSSRYGRKEPSEEWIFRTKGSGFTTRLFPLNQRPSK